MIEGQWADGANELVHETDEVVDRATRVHGSLPDRRFSDFS
jgi:hypothetical protein